MPTVKVGKKTKKFPYTKRGVMMAKQYAKKMGGKMMMEKGMMKNG